LVNNAGGKKGVSNYGKGGFKVSEENESGLREWLFGDDHSESKDKVLQYVVHRLKAGARLRDVLEEEYVVRNTTQVERDEIIRDPRLVQQDREGLQQEFKSDELKPERSTEAAKGQNYEDPRRRGRFGGVDPGAGPRSTGA
jgi:hypothetical protein